MPINQTPAIVLKTYDLRETSKIVVFFSKEYGKVKGVLKGIRKDPQKFGSSVDQLSVNDIVYYEYRNAELHLVSQCDMTQFYGAIRQDYKKMTAASYILELVDKIVPLEQPNQKIYELMIQFFEGLNETEDISRLVYIFQIKILKYSGFKPHLDCCVKTAQPITSRARFSLKLGGLVAPDVNLTDDQAVFISQGAIASILHIEQNEWLQCLRLRISDAIKEELKYVLNHFLVFHLEQHLNSTRYLHQHV